MPVSLQIHPRAIVFFLLSFSYYRLSMDFTKLMCEIRSHLNRGDSRLVMSPSQRALSKQVIKNWEPWDKNMRKSNNHRMIQQLAFHTQQTLKILAHKILIHDPWTTILTLPFFPTNCTTWNRVKSRLSFCPGTLWDSSVTLSGVPMTIGSHF